MRWVPRSPPGLGTRTPARTTERSWATCCGPWPPDRDRTASTNCCGYRQFWTPDPVRAEDFPAVLERLPLTAWPAEEGPAAPHPATPDTVFRTLLTAAVRSPAYGSGLHGAYGRLAAWHSLAGPTGVPADRPLTEVAEAAGRTTWLRIAPSTSWFSAIVWDVAVAALRPGGQEIAVLAATDSD
ncbi:DUF6183 family protein [Streptomyces sp. NPDC006864]|uniref:DUF6183 family protein n=1 Tax=Streptomyces sp. NPDC006864 TaxID=3154780 RepID=UPI0034526931